MSPKSIAVRLLVLAAAIVPPALAMPTRGMAAADQCLAIADAPARGSNRFASGPAPRKPSPFVPAAVRLADLKLGEVRLTFVGHSTFLIESQRGVQIATDYNDYVRPAIIPQIATMNRAHSSHFTDFPSPQIRHVLRGWDPAGGVAQHDVTLDDVRVRNVPTNIRDWQGGTVVFGNSIFIFEVAGLCIAHLGHLHHTLTDQQVAQIGQMDIVLVPVDGSYTLDLAGMVEVLKQLKARMMIPMHYFSPFTLGRFLDAVRGDFEVRTQADPTMVISRGALPAKPEVVVLPGI